MDPPDTAVESVGAAAGLTSGAPASISGPCAETPTYTMLPFRSEFKRLSASVFCSVVIFPPNVPPDSVSPENDFCDGSKNFCAFQRSGIWNSASISFLRTCIVPGVEPAMMAIVAGSTGTRGTSGQAAVIAMLS